MGSPAFIHITQSAVATAADQEAFETSLKELTIRALFGISDIALYRLRGIKIQYLLTCRCERIEYLDILTESLRTQNAWFDVVGYMADAI